MKVFLLRHADAHYTRPDSARALSERGRKSVAALAERLQAEQFAGVQTIWHSTYSRARETAHLFAEALELPQPVKEKKGLAPGDNPFETAYWLATSEVDCLLVGHNPHFEILVSELTGIMSFEFHKCALHCIEKLESPSIGHPIGQWKFCETDSSLAL